MTLYEIETVEDHDLTYISAALIMVGPPSIDGCRSRAPDRQVSDRQVSDRRSFSGPLRFSFVEFLRSGRSGEPPLHHHSQRRP
ncbi:hypothetical protein EVAR_4186_1 [Eumeta japonica]|uniref:Uncharacterized protein n=1 Tax=Eumeta variegata TaxID=151549 RepID=A0A4C1TFZ4_EUMVA|nr:hypothetical protein EVAR_4186_1 [Eumeta japonica]